MAASQGSLTPITTGDAELEPLDSHQKLAYLCFADAQEVGVPLNTALCAYS
ncbi:MAG: hypothetical protein ICV76_06695 [Nitrospiraceae bacterium]|nr:hypothetical protein [Nitrospiraceae bacterium]